LEEPFLPAVERINDVRQTETHTHTHTAETLVPDSSAFEVVLVIEKLKSHRSPGIDQIPAELIKARGTTIHYESINLLFLFGIWRNCLRSEKVDHCTYP